MSANYGIKISRKGVNVMGALTANNKRFFQLISTDGCLLVKEHSDTPSDINKFFGYTIATDSWIGDVGAITEAAVHSPGVGYTVGDYVTIAGGDGNAMFWISNVDGAGGVGAGYTAYYGKDYVVGTNISTTGGTGNGFTVDIVSVTKEVARPLNYDIWTGGRKVHIIFENLM